MEESVSKQSYYTIKKKFLVSFQLTVCSKYVELYSELLYDDDFEL